jgi:hypothetical protein
MPNFGRAREIVVKGTVQQKLTGILSGINRKLMISSIFAGYFFINFYGFCPFNNDPVEWRYGINPVESFAVLILTPLEKSN